MIFNAAESEARKNDGMKRAARARTSLLTIARGIAVDLAKDGDGTCNADQVAHELHRRGLGNLGNAAGSLFKGGRWEFTGAFVKSKRAHAHSNLLRVWRLL